jgi:site-specific recombinase XerD
MTMNATRIFSTTQRSKVSSRLPKQGVMASATIDHLLLLMIYRHGLRVSEAIALKLKDVNLLANQGHDRPACPIGGFL